MKRQKDNSLHVCKICKEEVVASGMGSHLYHKHSKLTSDEYAKTYGEFRKSKLEKSKKLSKKYSCKECPFIGTSHKHLMHHIEKEHNSWQDYIIKHEFNTVHPTCKCGCGEKVKLIRSGKNEKGERVYARDYIQGHDTRKRKLGYRQNTLEQRQRMRESAIKRMKEGNGTFHQAGPSKGEREINTFLKSKNLKTITSDKKLLKGLEIDILIPELQVAIEYNGSYFHSEKFKDRKYHLKKTEELAEQGYRLIHIWEPDWYKNKEIVKSMLSHICNKTEDRINARDTVVKEISRAESVDFLEQNHLQGSAVGRVYLGLFHKEDLIQVMTFSKLRSITGRVHKEGSFELLRSATKLNTLVRGGNSKLLKYFKENFNPTYILSFANRDWSTGNLYRKLGMQFTGYTPPGYFYVKSRIKYSRIQFQKHKLVKEGEDPTLTESEIMLNKGFMKVWDCGNYRYEWKKE